MEMPILIDLKICSCLYACVGPGCAVISIPAASYMSYKMCLLWMCLEFWVPLYKQLSESEQDIPLNSQTVCVWLYKSTWLGHTVKQISCFMCHKFFDIPFIEITWLMENCCKNNSNTYCIENSLKLPTQ